MAHDLDDLLAEIEQAVDSNDDGYKARAPARDASNPTGPTARQKPSTGPTSASSGGSRDLDELLKIMGDSSLDEYSSSAHTPHVPTIRAAAIPESSAADEDAPRSGRCVTVCIAGMDTSVGRTTGRLARRCV